jgi:hypothetical protein
LYKSNKMFGRLLLMIVFGRLLFSEANSIHHCGQKGPRTKTKLWGPLNCCFCQEFLYLGRRGFEWCWPGMTHVVVVRELERDIQHFGRTCQSNGDDVLSARFSLRCVREHSSNPVFLFDYTISYFIRPFFFWFSWQFQAFRCFLISL